MSHTAPPRRDAQRKSGEHARPRSRSRERISKEIDKYLVGKKARKRRTNASKSDQHQQPADNPVIMPLAEAAMTLERRFEDRFGKIRGTTMFAAYPVPAAAAHPATNRSVAELASAFELRNMRNAILNKKPRPGEQLLSLDALSPYQRFFDSESKRAVTMQILPDDIPTTAEELRDNPTGTVGLEAENNNGELQHATWMLVCDNVREIHPARMWDADRTTANITVTGGHKNPDPAVRLPEVSDRAVSTRVRGLAESIDHISTMQAVPIDQVPPPSTVETVTKPDGSKYLLVGNTVPEDWYEYMLGKTAEARKDGMPPENVLANIVTRTLRAEDIATQMFQPYGFFRACVFGKTCRFQMYMQDYIAAGWRPPYAGQNDRTPVVSPCAEYLSPEVHEAVRVATITGLEVKYRNPDHSSMCILCIFYVQKYWVLCWMAGIRNMHEMRAVQDALSRPPEYEGAPMPALLRPGTADRTVNPVNVMSNSGAGSFREGAVLLGKRIAKYGILGDTLNVMQEMFVPEQRVVRFRNYREIDRRIAMHRPVQPVQVREEDVDPELVTQGVLLGFAFSNTALFDKAAVSAPTSPFVFRASNPSVLVGTHIKVPSADELTVALLVRTRHKVPHDVIKCVCRPVIAFADDLRQQLATKYAYDDNCPAGLLPSLKVVVRNEDGEIIEAEVEDELRDGDEKVLEQVSLEKAAAELVNGRTDKCANQADEYSDAEYEDLRDAVEKVRTESQAQHADVPKEKQKDIDDDPIQTSVYWGSHSVSGGNDEGGEGEEGEGEEDGAQDAEKKGGDSGESKADDKADADEYYSVYSEDENGPKPGSAQPQPQPMEEVGAPAEMPTAASTDAAAQPVTDDDFAFLDEVDNDSEEMNEDEETKEKPLVPDLVMRFFTDPIITPLLIASRTDRRWTRKHATPLIKFLAELKTVGRVMEYCIMLAVLIKASLEEAVIKKMAVRNRAVTCNTRLMLFEAVADNYANVAWFVERMVAGLPVDDRYICEIAHRATTGIIDPATGVLQPSTIAEVEQLIVSPIVHVPRAALHLVQEENTVSFASDPAMLSAQTLSRLGIMDYRSAVVLTMANFPQLVQMALLDERIVDIATGAATKYTLWDPRSAARLVGITAAAAAVNEATAQQVVSTAARMAGPAGRAPTVETVMDALEVSIPAQMWRWTQLGSVARVVVLLLIARINVAEEAIARITRSATLDGAGYNAEARGDPLQADVARRVERAAAGRQRSRRRKPGATLIDTLNEYQVHGMLDFRNAHIPAAAHLIDTVAAFHRSELEDMRTSEGATDASAHALLLHIQGGLDRVPLEDDVWCPRMHLVSRAGDIPDISNAIFAAGIIGYGSGMYHPVRKKRGGAGTATRVVAEKRSAHSVLQGDWKRARVARRKANGSSSTPPASAPSARRPRVRAEGATASLPYTSVQSFKSVIPPVGANAAALATTALWGDEGTGEEGVPWDPNAWAAWGGRGILTIVRLLRMLIVRPANVRSTSTNYEAQTRALIAFMQDVPANTADTMARTLITTSLLAGLGGLYRWSGAWPSFTRWLTVTATIRTSGACPKQLIDFVRRYPMISVVCLRMALVYSFANDTALVEALVVSGGVPELNGFARATVAAGHVLGVHMAMGTRLDAIETGLCGALMQGSPPPLQPASIPYLGMPEDECVRHIMAKAHKKRSDMYARMGAAAETQRQKNAIAAAALANPSAPPKLLNRGAIKAASQAKSTRATSFMRYPESREWSTVQVLIARTRPGWLPRSTILEHLIPLGGGYWDQSCLLTTAPWIRASQDPERLKRDIALARWAYDTVVAATRRQATLEDAENALASLPSRLYRSVYGLLYAYEMHSSVRGTIISDMGIVSMQRMAIHGKRRGIMSRVPKQVPEQTITAATCVPIEVYGSLLAYMPEAFTCRRCCKVVATALVGHNMNKLSAAAHGTKDVGYDSTRGTTTCNCWWRHMKRNMAKRNANEGSADVKKQTVWSRSNSIYCGDSKTTGVPTIGYAYTLSCSVRRYKDNPMGGVTVVCSTCCGRQILVDRCLFLPQRIVCEQCVLPSRRRGEDRTRHSALTVATAGLSGTTGIGMTRVGTGRREVGAAELNAVGLIPVVGQTDFDERACTRCPVKSMWTDAYVPFVGIDDRPNGTFKFMPNYLCKQHCMSVRMAAFGNGQCLIDNFLRLIVTREWLDSLSDSRLAYFRVMAEDEQRKNMAAQIRNTKRKRGHMPWVRWSHHQGGVLRDNVFEALRFKGSINYRH